MNMKMSRIQTALVVLGLAMPALVRADQQVSTKYSLPMKAYCKVTESGCLNSPGPTITLEGVIALGGLGANLVFQNNEKGTHTATVTYGTNVTLLALGGAIEIPKQPVQGGVGGNPHIWIQFHDGQGNNLTKEIYLGRCVQGLSIAPEFVSEVVALADVAAVDCSNNPGPVISVGGTITFKGLHARFIFRNNAKGTHTAEDVRDVELIVNGSAVTVPKSPAKGGAGGNPIISIQFVDDTGAGIAPAVKLGRCVQL